MELEEMKHTWQEMSKRLENQEATTTRLLEKLTNEKYHSKINRIGNSEYIGTIVCYIGAAYLIINFVKLADVTMQIFALISILLLFILPIISLQSVRAIKGVKVTSKNYLETIHDFGRRKVRFQKLQKLNISLGLFLMLVAVPVLSAIQGKDISTIPYFWTLIFPISVAFFLVFAFWVISSYNKLLTKTEKMISDINK